MKLLNFNVIKLTASLILGIIIGTYLKVSLSLSIILFIFFALLFTIYFLWLYKTPKSSSVFGITTLLIFIFIGIIRTELYDETNRKSHYINSEINFENYHNISFKISKRLKPDTYNYKFFAEILSIENRPYSGKILLNISRDSVNQDFFVDNIYFTNTTLTEVVKPKNPFQFNYHNYLKQRNVNHQIYLSANNLLPVKSSSKSIYGYADGFRNTVNSKLKLHQFSDDTLSILNALLLGQRQNINPELYNNYVNAGVIHILAVSGLHVGIIFIILTHLLRPLHYIKYGKFVLKPIAIIIILWAFAFIAGLSPSVTRAVTMFSIVAIAGFLKRPRNIINTLVISGFVLLLIKPIYLYDVGFQMSYLAVLAIVIIQPIIYKLWQPKVKAIDYIWQIFTVTLAAQIGVAPIGLFYFHQFPGLFLISNLVIIPFLGLILSFGLLVIFLSLLEILPPFFDTALNYVIESLNAFISWISKFENFIFKDISINIYQVFTTYLIISCGIYLWKKRSFGAVQFMLYGFLLFSATLLYSKLSNSSDEFVIYNTPRATLISKKSTNALIVYHNLDSLALKNNTAIRNYKVGNFISDINSTNLKTVYTFNKRLILVIDSLGVYNTKSFKPDLVILRNSPRINLSRLIDSIKPKQIIADASNYKSYMLRWKTTCLNKKIPFHSTYEKGAFILK